MRIPWFLELLTRLPHRRARIQPGLYHYAREANGARVRLHLRVDSAGDGLLLANAAAMTRLSPSGVMIAKGLLDGDKPAAIVQQAKKHFHGVTVQQIVADVAAVEALIGRMESPAGNYPILNLADPAFSPKAMPLERPISADVPLCPPFHMRQILDRLWQLGIPHVTIIVGRDPDAAALIRAVQRAGDLGMIAGVRGRGSDLIQGTRIADMAAAGLDHLDVYCMSERDELHDALAGPGDRRKAVQALAVALKHEVCPVVEIALARSTLASIAETLEAMARHGLSNVSMFAIATADASQASAGDCPNFRVSENGTVPFASGALLAHELAPAARLVEELAERLGLRLLWRPTVRFDPAKPLGEQACGGPRTSGDTAIRVEPDGSVIPARGPFQAAGNLITDKWETIEQSNAYRSYRRRVESDTHCDQCPGLAICAADCPRDPAGWADCE